MKRYIPQSPYQLELMEYRRIEEHIRRVPALLLPVSGLSPMGTIPVGAELQCSMAVADKLSKEYRIISTPPVAFAQGACFQGFGGCAGVLPNHTRMMIRDLLKGWALQGITHFFIVRSAWPLPEQVSPVAGKLRNRLPAIECHVLDWRRDPGIRKVVASHSSSTDDPRAELAVIQLLRALGLEQRKNPEFLLEERLQLGSITAWKKGGRDPRTLRMLSPGGSLLARNNSVGPTEWGAELLETILERFGEKIRACGFGSAVPPGSKQAKDAHGND